MPTAWRPGEDPLNGQVLPLNNYLFTSSHSLTFFDDVKNWREAEVFKSDRQLRPLISVVSPAFDEGRCRLKDSYDRDCNPSES